MTKNKDTAPDVSYMVKRNTAKQNQKRGRNKEGSWLTFLNRWAGVSMFQRLGYGKKGPDIIPKSEYNWFPLTFEVKGREKISAFPSKEIKQWFKESEEKGCNINKLVILFNETGKQRWVIINSNLFGFILDADYNHMYSQELWAFGIGTASYMIIPAKQFFEWLKPDRFIKDSSIPFTGDPYP